MSGAFLQTTTAKQLKKLITDRQDLLTDFDRETVASFLSGGTGAEYVPASGEITGILKEMLSTMSKSLSEAEAQEADSVKSYEELMAAKEKEVNALTKSIESKTKRVGELAVEIVQMCKISVILSKLLKKTRSFCATWTRTALKKHRSSMRT
jgi:hypothetical protein